MEPIHVHISKGKPSEKSTKIWLTKAGGCIVANNDSKIPEKHLREIIEVISNNYFFIISVWKKHFPSFELKFYC